MIRESQIKHENGAYWVLDTKRAYEVLRAELTHSVVDSAYARDADGLSIAIARCDYLAKKAKP
jgi:hypothetical protein